MKTILSLIIFFTTLNCMAMDVCDTWKIGYGAGVQAGYLCSTDRTTWRIENPGAHYSTSSEVRRGIVFTDLTSGLKIVGTVGDNLSPNDAERICANLGARLPTGYRKDFNGKNGFPNSDSEMETLYNHGIANLIEPIPGPLWSSSKLPPELLDPNTTMFSGYFGLDTVTGVTRLSTEYPYGGIFYGYQAICIYP